MINITYIKHKETIHNFTWRFLQIFGKQGITFLIFIICAKFLVPYEFGVYNYIMAIIFFLIMFGDFGISTATSKYVAEYNVTDKEKLKAVLFNSGIIILSLTIIISFLAIVVGPLYLKEKYIYVLYLLPLIFLAPMTSLYDGIYRGLKRFKQLAISSLFVGFISLTFVYFLINSYGLIGALIAQNFSYLLFFLALAFGYREFNFKINKNVINEIGRYSFLVGLSMIGYFLYTRVDIIILGHFGFIEEIGYYEIINKTFQILLLPVMILASVVAPNSARNMALKRYSYIKEKMIRESLFLFFIGLIIAILTWFVFPFFINLFLSGYEIVLLKKMLSIILLIVPFRFFSSFLSIAYITPLGLVKITSVTLFLFGVINLLLNIILIHYLGYIGVIYATLISQFGYIVSYTSWLYLKTKK